MWEKKRFRWWGYFGEIEVEEYIWRSREQNYVRVYAQRIGVKDGGQTRRLERIISDFGSESSFEQANRRLKEHYGFERSTSRIRKTTLEVAKKIEEQMEKEYEKPFRNLPAQGLQWIIAQADGTMICTIKEGQGRKGDKTREWKEMRLLLGQGKDKVETTYGATLGEVDEVGRRWGHCVKKAGWALNSRIHVVADGAEWIRLQSQEVFGSQESFLLDFYHATEYLASASERCCPENPRRWLRTQKRRLKRGAHDLVLKELEAHVEPEGVDSEQAVVRSALRYLSNRKDQIDYPEAIKQELPIGSGRIESGHRHVLQARLKKPGAAWLIANAQSMAQLRVLRANNQWNAFWDHHLDLELIA